MHLPIHIQNVNAVESGQHAGRIHLNFFYKTLRSIKCVFKITRLAGTVMKMFLTSEDFVGLTMGNSLVNLFAVCFVLLPAYTGNVNPTLSQILQGLDERTLIKIKTVHHHLLTAACV